MNDYQRLIANRRWAMQPSGFEVDESTLCPMAYDFQKAVVKWALRKGKSCIFADCGLGKGLMLLMWADAVCRKTDGKVMILCPLAVGKQLEREAERFGIEGVKYVRTPDEVSSRIFITNYERLHLFDEVSISGVVCDESSIIKGVDSKTKTLVLTRFRNVPYRLACTATPAPNDHMELGNHAEFVGAMKSSEMLATFFTHDGGETSKWRLRGHAASKFWEWVASWAVMCRSPEDLGFDGSKFVLPELKIVEHVIETEAKNGRLFAVDAVTLNDQRAVRRETIPQRLAKVHELASGSTPHIVWCNLNAESESAADALKASGAVEVTGSQSEDVKSSRLVGFSQGEHPIIVSKPSLSGFGLNWQHCADMTFFGLSHSWEEFYQAVRRCYRFGQSRPVTVNVVVSDQELVILENIKRKQADADVMAKGMIEAMQGFSKRELGTATSGKEYKPSQQMELPKWIALSKSTGTTGASTVATAAS
jgi:hypothetical protein